MGTSPFPTSSTNGVHHPTDEAIDSLYSFWPGATPAPQPCPEALFSLTLRGKLDGQETLLTVRGMTAAEFQANLQAAGGRLSSAASAREWVHDIVGPTRGNVRRTARKKRLTQPGIPSMLIYTAGDLASFL